LTDVEQSKRDIEGGIADEEQREHGETIKRSQSSVIVDVLIMEIVC
jgi:hypothetical protein